MTTFEHLSSDGCNVAVEVNILLDNGIPVSTVVAAPVPIQSFYAASAAT
jgi:hypothetical protein